MANLIPQSGNQWMRWIERRLSGLEARRPPPQISNPLEFKTPRYNAALSGNFNATTSVLYNIGFNVNRTSPQHFDPDGLFTYKQVVPGGEFGIVVSQPGLYFVSCRVQQGGGTVAGGRKVFLHRHTDVSSAYSSEEAPSATPANGVVSQVSGIIALQANEGVVVKYRQNSGGVIPVVAAAAASATDPYAASTLVIVPIGAYNW